MQNVCYEAKTPGEQKYHVLLENGYWEENCYPDKTHNWATLCPNWDRLSWII